MPVGEVERTVRGELHRDRAEVAVLGLQEVVAEGQLEARALLRDRVLLGPEEADGVVDQDVALHVVGEVAAADELEAGGRTDHLGLGHEVGRKRGELAERHAQRGRGHPAQVGVGRIREEILAEGVKGDAPGIGDAHAGGALKLAALGRVAEEAAVGAAFDAVGGLDVAVQERALGQVEGAGRVGPEGADRVVRIVVVEAAQDDLGAVGAAIAVGVAQQDEVTALREVDALGGELEGERQVQAAGEDRLLVGLTVAVGVLEDEDLVVGLGIARAPLRVARHRGHPEATAVVEGQADRIREVGELLLGREEVDLIAGGHGEGLHSFFARQVVGRAILCVARGIVGLHGRQHRRLRIGRGHVERRALGGGPDSAVADQHQLVELLQFGREIIGTEGLVAAAEHVDAIRHLGELLPIPVLIVDRDGERGEVDLGGGTPGKGAVDERPGDVDLAGGVEIDERELAGGRDFLDGLSVKGEVRVDGGGRSGALRGGGDVERARGDQHDLRGGLAVVFLLGGVVEPGFELSLEGGDALLALERLGVAEPREDHVGLETGQPLVGRLGEPGAGMAGAPEVLGLGERVELLGAREGERRVAAGVVAIARGVAVVAQITNRQVTAGKAPLELGLEGRIPEQSLTLPATDEHDDAALGGVNGAGG